MEFTTLKRIPSRADWAKYGDAERTYRKHADDVGALLAGKVRLHFTFDHAGSREKADLANAGIYNLGLKTDGLRQIVLHRLYAADAYRYAYEAFDYVTEPVVPHRQIVAVKVAPKDRVKSENGVFPVYELMKNPDNVVSGVADDGCGRYGLYIKLDASCVGRGKVIPSLGREHVKRLLGGIVAAFHRAGPSKTAGEADGDYAEYLGLRGNFGDYAFLGGDKDVWDGRLWTPKTDAFDHVELSVTDIIGDAMMLVTVSRL